MPSQPSLHASRKTIAPSSSKCSLRTMLRCEPLSTLASAVFRISIGILAVELEQIECAMHGAGDGPVTAYQFKNRQAILVANDSLAVDQARPNRQRLNGHFDERKAAGEII